MGPNEVVTRILKIAVHQETKEPIPEVMVKDGMGVKLNQGIERKKSIIAGDLVGADKFVLLHYLFVESMQVDPSYFKDFTVKNVNPYDEKKEEKVVPKTDAPKWETPGGDTECAA